jgi:NADH-quinone oxidoreductase subunit J
MSPANVQVAFYTMTAMTLISALVVVSNRNIVHAGFWLLPTFLGVAGLYALLNAHFFVVVQVLIYVGAILVLMLFALMLTLDVMNPLIPQTNRFGISAAISSFIAVAYICWILYMQPWNAGHLSVPDGLEQTRQLGEALIGPYALPFEISSLLLLAALIGAVVLAKSEKEPVPPPPPLPMDEDNHTIPAE